MVLFLSGVKGDTRRYRTFHPYQQLQMAGVPCTYRHITAGGISRLLPGMQVVVLHRVPMDSNVKSLVRQARRQGTTVLVDVDDLTFDPQAFQWINSPDFQDPVRRRIYQQDMLRQRATIEASDGVIASTNFLAEEIRKLGKPAWVHRNGFSQEVLQLSESARRSKSEGAGPTVIGYASGTPTHDRDFALVRQALLEILAEQENVTLHLVGPLDPGAGFERFGGSASVRIRRLPFVPWRNLPAILRDFDINLAPLVLDNPFSQSKSEIKYMEAGLVDVPTVASPTDAFRFAITHGENGLLADSPEAWKACLLRLVTEPDFRRQMGKEAYRHVLQEYSPEKRADQLLETLNEISEHVRGKPLFSFVSEAHNGTTVNNIPVEWERMPTNTQRGWYSLRHRGILVLLGEIWVYIRRLMSPIFPFRKP